MIKQIPVYVVMMMLVGTVASCAAPKPKSRSKPAAAVPAPASSAFEGIGRVKLHRGQPCATQIMFDFDIGFGQTVWLAAGVKEERALTAAAERRRRVRVFGTWRHGKESRCRYINVARVNG
jgi:hypothetical protein